MNGAGEAPFPGDFYHVFPASCQYPHSLFSSGAVPQLATWKPKRWVPRCGLPVPPVSAGPAMAGSPC